MNKKDIANLIGKFTWSFGMSFFIETANGNFIWNSPNYGGNNVLHEWNGDYTDWCEFEGIEFGRDKGSHVISDYTGDFEFLPLN